MAHSIRAIIGPLQAITDVIHAAGDPPATDLTYGISIIPLGEDQIEKLTGKGSRDRVSGFDDLTLGLEEALISLAKRGNFAYIETEYFGGSGGQVAAVFSPGVAPVHFSTEANPINLALKSLGVVTQPGTDEFDTLGLGRFRNLKHLGMKNTWGGSEPSSATLTSTVASVKPSQPNRRQRVAFIGLAALVVLFWLALAFFTNAGFDFVLPAFSPAR